jgi:hypothetical protein
MILFDSFGNEIKKLARIYSDQITDTRPASVQLTSLGSMVDMEILDETEASIQLTIGVSISLSASYSIDGIIFYPMPFFNPNTETYTQNASLSGNYQIIFPSGTKKIRFIPIAISGTATVTLRAVKNQVFLYAKDIPATLSATQTAAVNTQTILTIPASAGLYTYITGLYITKFAAANLVAAATPVLVTTTNILSAPVFSFSAAADLQGTVEKTQIETKMKSALGSGVSVTAPATPNVIWRMNAIYYYGY